MAAAARVLVSAAAAAERNETDGEADDKTLCCPPSPLLPNEQGVHIDFGSSYNQDESVSGLLTEFIYRVTTINVTRKGRVGRAA